MNNIIKRTWNRNSLVNIEDLRGVTFQDEGDAHTFVISGIDGDGNPVTLSGTPSGTMLRPDNTDQTLTCSVSGGKVYATLPDECYDVPGRAGITIFLTSDSQTVAIYAAVVSVTRTQSGTAAPGTTADVVDLVNAINAAIAGIPATDTAIKAAMAPTYSNSSLYAVGSYAWYNGTLYRCTTAITTAETWTSGHWTAAALGNDLRDLKSAIGDDESNIRNMLMPVIGTGISDAVSFTNSNGSFSGDVGSTIEIGTQTTWRHTSVSVTSGDVYVVIFKTTGNDTNKNEYIAFTDSNDIIISKSGIPEATQIYTCRVVTVPSDASKMYVRSFTTSSNAISIYKVKETISNTAMINEENIDKLEDATEYVNKMSFNYGVTTQTVNDLTFSIDEDGILTLNGTPSDKVRFDLMGGKRTTNTRNITANVPIIVQRELISGTANGFPVFRNTYDYTQSSDGTAVELDKTFVPSADGCLFLRINTGTSFTNAKFKFSVSIGAVKYPIVPHKLSAIDFALREKLELSDKSKSIFDNAIQAKNRMLFSAHRGAEGQAPYGSYPSYELACKQGWDMLQIAQARQSADGTWYCLHNTSVNEQTNGEGNIADLTDSDIDDIYQDVGVNIDQYTHEEMKLPTLESVLKLAYRYGLMISIRMGSLPNYDGQGEIPSSWTSFINLCKKYRPERMMFSGSYEQVRTLKALTPNWHGQVYIVSADVQDTIDALKANGYTNCSLLVVEAKVNSAAIKAAHDAGYYFVTAQIKTGQSDPPPTVDDFISFSDMGVDIAQTGLSDIHSINE